MVLILVGDHLKQETLVRIGGIEGRSGIATFEQSLTTGQPQSAFEPFSTPMALVAVLFKQRMNLCIEEGYLLGLIRILGDSCRDRQGDSERKCATQQKLGLIA